MRCRSAPTTILVALFFVLVLKVIPSLAATTVITSQSDFQSGTVPAEIDATTSPGELRLSTSENLQTETTNEDFGYGDRGSFSSKIENGSVSINDGIYLTPIFLEETYSTDDIRGVSFFSDSQEDDRKFLHIHTQEKGLYLLFDAGTVSTDDDSVIAHYDSTTTPALSDDSVYKSVIDVENDILYVVTGGGVDVIDRNGTVDQSDDEVLTTYADGQHPIDIELNLEDDLIYIATSAIGVGAIVYNTQGTVSVEDDTSYSYSNVSTPAIGTYITNEIHYSSELETLYIATPLGLYAIDTKGTVSQADDEVEFLYNASSDPATTHNNTKFTYYDSSTNLLYIGSNNTGGGLAVIDTQGTTTSDDDTQVAAYTTSSSPALPEGSVNYVHIDASNDLLYISNYQGGVVVMDTDGTATGADDTVTYIYNEDTEGYYNGGFGPLVSSAFIHAETNTLYIVDRFAVSVDNLDDGYSAGTFISQPLPVLAELDTTITWDATIPNGTTLTIQTRVPGEDSIVDQFDGSSTLEYLGDYYEYEDPFEFATEIDGVFRLSGLFHYFDEEEEEEAYYSDASFGLGETFDAGSIVYIKYRVITDVEDFESYPYTGDYSDYLSAIYTTNEWVVAKITTTEPFDTVGFGAYDPSVGEFNSGGGYIDIDYIAVVNWADWSVACSMSGDCEISAETLADQYFYQYKANLATEDSNETPSLNSITFTSGEYSSSGVYTSSIIDGSSLTDWTSLTAEKTTPTGTSISFQTRTGNTSSPDGTWSSYQSLSGSSSIQSPPGRYIQFTATLSTTDGSVTPTLSSVTLSTDSTPPSDDFGDTDFELTKINGANVNNDDKHPKIYTNDKTPKLKFAIIEDDHGIDHYEIRITDTDSLGRKRGADYTWIENIPGSGDNNETKDRNNFIAKYTNGYIEVTPKDGKKLQNGIYYVKIRAYDAGGNFKDSDEVILIIGDEYSDSSSGENISDATINLTNIGQIPYNPAYKTYYYTSSLLTLMGTTSAPIDIKVYVDGNQIYTGMHNQGFKITNGLVNGTRAVKIVGGQTTIEFTLIIDPTRQSFPTSLQ